ncbi:hypothetical protein H0264_16935 [Nocardia huaxiensis]|uniref:Uncharacterized protein n=1 Tax=Nocardia huaxiensis TaxID=2755382 RepID=A0A7D7A1J7_9NOCA|nr:DUF5988 family protein [Nocardia huaxiensis]QLY33689.1 hypothetical protein H0264_16935 [Nocardia huaxiensis]
MALTAKAILVGGPNDLPERIVPITSEPEIKISHRNGYEHFQATAREEDTPQGTLRVYEWSGRTKVAE